MTTNDSVPPAGSCHCATLRKATRKVTQIYDAALAPTGLKTTQYSLLSEINRRADCPPTMVELAEITVMDRSTLGRNLRPLQREGLIQLTVGKDDRRSRRIALTNKGRALLKQGRQLWAKAQSAFETTYGAEHAARLRKELLQLAATDFTPKG